MPDMIGWFAGLIDGEGCLTFNFAIRNRVHEHTLNITPTFEIAMRSGEWENIVAKILSDNNIAFSKDIHNHLSRIRVSGLKGVKQLCKLILPYSVEKKPLVELFIRYTGKSKKNQHIAQNKDEILQMAQDVDFLRAFNRKRNIPYKWDGNKVKQFYGLE